MKRIYPNGMVTHWSFNGYAWTFIKVSNVKAS